MSTAVINKRREVISKRREREEGSIIKSARRMLLHTASAQDGDGDPDQAIKRPYLRDDVRPPQIAYVPTQAAIATGRTRTRIFAAIKAGELIARKDGKATLIEHEELVRWVRSLPIVSRS